MEDKTGSNSDVRAGLLDTDLIDHVRPNTPKINITHNWLSGKDNQQQTVRPQTSPTRNWHEITISNKQSDRNCFYPHLTKQLETNIKIAILQREKRKGDHCQCVVVWHCAVWKMLGWINQIQYLTMRCQETSAKATIDNCSHPWVLWHMIRIESKQTKRRTLIPRLEARLAAKQGCLWQCWLKTSVPVTSNIKHHSHSAVTQRHIRNKRIQN